MTRAKWIFAAIVLGLLGAHFGPLLVRHPTQDACSFGPLSNERYRELLAEARRRTPRWRPLPWDDREAGTLLNERFDDLSRGMTSVYERLAVMHAMLRALGAD